MTVAVDRETWLKARLELMARERELTRLRDALAAERRALPRLRIDKDYRFAGVEGEVALGDLFGPHSQLIAQHFMFGPDWDEGCPACSFWLDSYDRMGPHLAARDIALAVIARAPIEKLEAYRRRMGWVTPWVSSLGGEFNFDFNVSFTDEELKSGAVDYNYRTGPFPASEAPGFSVFLNEGGAIFHTYSVFARGLDPLNSAYQLIDLSPKGRDEAALAHPMAWVRRRDSYDAPPP